MEWSRRLVVEIEVPRGSRVKRHPDGRLQYASPWRSPFNYGFVPDAPLAPDGDPQDALFLGPRLDAGVRASGWGVGCVRVTDGGRPDDKWVVAPDGYEVRPADRLAVADFFVRYARWKTVLARLRGRSGAEVHGIDWVP
ncbi:MAG: inorganic diphosphatase [Myxococcota bacterium]